MNDQKQANPVSQYVVPTDRLVEAAKAAAQLGAPAGGLARLTAVIARGKTHPKDKGLTIVGQRELDALEQAVDALVDPAHAVEVIFRDIEEGRLGKPYAADDTPPIIVDPGPKPDPDPKPDPIPPRINQAQRLHDALDLTIPEAAERAKARHFQRIAANKPRLVKPTSDDRNNRVPRHRDILFDQVWQWTLNREVVYTAAIDLSPYDAPYMSLRVPVAPIPELSVYSNLELREILYEDAKWVIRSYNNYEVEISDCTIIGKNVLETGNRFGTLLREHFGYTETEGNYIYRRNLVENIGEHAAHNAYRPFPFAQYDPSNRFFSKRTEYLIEDSVSINCDQGVGRGSFAYTLFNPGDFAFPGRVVMDGMEAFSQWDFIRSQSAWDSVPYQPDFEPGGSGSINSNAMGAFVVHHYDIEKHLERARAMGSTNTHPTESVEIRNALIMKSFTPMPIGVIRGTKDILIEDSAVYADRRHKSPFIHIDDDAQVSAICRMESLVVRNVCFKGAGIRVHLEGGGHTDCPTDLVGKVAIWRPGTKSFEVRDTDLHKVYGADSRAKVAA